MLFRSREFGIAAHGFFEAQGRRILFFAQGVHDMAGRVFQGVPAPTNLKVPDYHFADDKTLIIGVKPEGAA